MKHPFILALFSALLAIALTVWGLWPEQDAPESYKQPVALILDTSIGVNSAVIAQGAQMAAREYGAELTVSALTGADVPEKQIDLIRDALEDGASAVLLVPARESIVSEAVRLCARHGANLVLLDACEACRGNTPYVGTDHVSSGIKAAETLVKISGAKRILILTSGDAVSSDRLQGAKLAVERQGAEPVVRQIPVIDGKPCTEGVREALSQYADERAVLCLDGALTECASRAIIALGRKDEVTLGGFDCDQTRIVCLENGSVRFTVLREPMAVGYKGLKNAMDMMKWDVQNPVEYVDVAVILREDILKPENVRLVFPLIQ